MSTRTRVAVIGGGQSCEHELSLASAASVRAALDPTAYDVVALTIRRDGLWLGPDERPLGSTVAIDDRVLVEEVVTGREIDVAVLGTPDGGRLVGPALEIVVPAGGLFDTDRKYDGTATFVLPADLAAPVAAELAEAAVRVYDALGCREVARVDLFVTPHGPVLNEVNTRIAGLDVLRGIAVGLVMQFHLLWPHAPVARLRGQHWRPPGYVVPVAVAGLALLSVVPLRGHPLTYLAGGPAIAAPTAVLLLRRPAPARTVVPA